MRLIAGSRRTWPARRCAPASRSGSRPGGRPIGAIRAIPACRRASISRDSHNVKSVDGRVAGAARFTDDSGTIDRLQGRRDLSAPHRAAGSAPSRCCSGSSSTTRSARSCACRPRAAPSSRSTARPSVARRRARRGRSAVPKLAKLGDSRAARHPRRAARSGQATHPRVIVDVAAPAERAASICSPKDRRRTGPCRCPSRSPARPPDCTASPSISTACRPAPAPRAPTLTFTAGVGRQRDRGRDPSRLILRAR